MRLAPDEEVAEWLEDLGAAAGSFEWDAGNRIKNLKQGVRAADTEGLLGAPMVFAGRIVEPGHDQPRWLLLGRDSGGWRWFSPDAEASFARSVVGQ